MHRWRTVRVLAVVGFAGGAALGVAGPAHANTAHIRHSARHGSSRYRVTAVAGSSKYLIYTRFKVANGKPQSPGELYALTRSGRRTKLGATTVHDTGFSLSGNTLFAESATDEGQVRLWNVRSGVESDRQSPYGSFPLAAAPHGYLRGSQTPAGIELDMETLSGSVTSLGIPFASVRGYAVTVGPTTLVAYQRQVEQYGGIKSENFADPGRFHTLLSAKHGPGAAFCGAPSATDVACRLGEIYSLRLYRLSGRQLAKTVESPNADFFPVPAVLNNTAVWLTSRSAGRLRQLASNGRQTRSSRSFDQHVAPISALGQVVVSNKSRTQLLGLTDATAKPQILIPIG